MMPPRSAARLLASAFALAVAGGGCSLIVGADVPDFKCAGTSPSACPSGLVCDTSRGLCVSDAGGEPLESGVDDATDEAATDGGKDADAAGPADLGAKCRVDADCKSHLCGASTILTTTITQTTGPICTTACCNSGECAPSFVCFNGGTGGGYCVPGTLAQRTPPASGGKGGGVACTASTECRSGLCAGTPKTCLDTCCAQLECGGSSVCRLKAMTPPGPSHDIWVCAAAEVGATGIPGDSCPDSTACASDNCIGVAASRICRPACSNTASCRNVSGFGSGHCLYGSSGSDVFRFCFSTTPTSGRTVAGTACADDSTCQSDYCDPELKKCAEVCGRDSDCATSEACRPSASNTPFLRCVPKP